MAASLDIFEIGRVRMVGSIANGSEIGIGTGWGGQSWTKTFFSMYGPSCLIDVYARPENSSWYGLDPWLTIYSNVTSIFLATA